MASRLALALALTAAFCLTGCAAEKMAAPIETTSPPASESPAPVPAPVPAPALPTVVGVTSAGLAVSYADLAVWIPYDDTAAVLDLFKDISGTEAETSIGSISGDLILHEWPGVRVTEVVDTRFWVTFSAPTIGETQIETVAGISVGSRRDDVLAAGGIVVWGTEPEMFNFQDAPARESLIAPDQGAQDFIAVFVENDVVSGILAPVIEYGDV